MNYWWVIDVVTNKAGVEKPVLVGDRHFVSEEAAESFLASVSHTPRAEVVMFPTVNSAKASQYLRGRRIKTEGTSAALTRVKHQKVKRSSEDEEATLKRKRFSRARAAGRRHKPRKSRVSKDSRLAISR